MKRPRPTKLEVFKASRLAGERMRDGLARMRKHAVEYDRLRFFQDLETVTDVHRQLAEFRSLEARRAYVLQAAAHGWLTYGQRDRLLEEIGGGPAPKRKRLDGKPG